jgi:hypothetical protein
MAGPIPEDYRSRSAVTANPESADGGAMAGAINYGQNEKK